MGLCVCEGQAKFSDRPPVPLCMWRPVMGHMHTASYVVRQLLLETELSVTVCQDSAHMICAQPSLYER